MLPLFFSNSNKKTKIGMMLALSSCKGVQGGMFFLNHVKVRGEPFLLVLLVLLLLFALRIGTTEKEIVLISVKIQFLEQNRLACMHQEMLQ